MNQILLRTLFLFALILFPAAVLCAQSKETSPTIIVPLTREVPGLDRALEIFYLITPTSPQFIFPTLTGIKDTAYFSLYSTAYTDKTFVILVANYSSDNPSYYVDINGNHDFTDDGPPIIAENGTADIVVSGPDGLGAGKYHLQRLAPSQAAHPYIFDLANQVSFGRPYSSPYYWVSSSGYTRVAYVKDKDKFITIGLFDRNYDGIFSDNYEDDEFYDGDVIVMAEGQSDSVHTLIDGGGYKMSDRVVHHETGDIEIREIDSLGRYLKIAFLPFRSPTDRVMEHDTLKNLSFPALQAAGSLLTMACKKNKDTTPEPSQKYGQIAGTWQQKDIVFAVSVKLGGQNIPAGTSILPLAPLLGPAGALFTRHGIQQVFLCYTVKLFATQFFHGVSQCFLFSLKDFHIKRSPNNYPSPQKQLKITLYGL